MQLTIDRVLHVQESGRMDFYSASYFATVADAPFFYEKGVVYGYGRKLNQEGKETDYVAINITRARSGIEHWSFGTPTESGSCVFDAETLAPYEVSDPLVPPSTYKVIEDDQVWYEHDTGYQEYWMSHYQGCSPKYVSVSTHPYSTPMSVNAASNITQDGGYIIDFVKPTIDPTTTLPICNGYACYPGIRDQKLFVPNIKRYFSDPSSRNRNITLVDFSPVGGCSFVRMNSCIISDKLMITLPSSSYNPSTQSLIVVLAGRILTPDRYYKLGRNITLVDRPFSPISIVDEKICAGELLVGQRTILGTVSKKTLIFDTNSFFIVVNKRNLQLLIHKMWWSTEEPIKPIPQQTYNTFANSHKVQFDKGAQGLLVDTVTNLVYDYTREQHTVTFYAENSTPITWETTTATIIPERPIVMLQRSTDNFMSARGMLFNKQTDIASDHVQWPRFAMFDFIFRG